MKKSTSSKKTTAKKSPVAVPKPKGPGLNLGILQEALTFMNQNGLSHFEYRVNSVEISLSLGKPNHVEVVAPTTIKNDSKDAPPKLAPPISNGNGVSNNASVQKEKKTVTIDSPFVGTFYRSPGPNQDSFVEVGQIVDKGQALCIIEAMKLMNEIESDSKGRIIRVLVDNATPVEFGEPLFELEPL